MRWGEHTFSRMVSSSGVFDDDDDADAMVVEKGRRVAALARPRAAVRRDMDVECIFFFLSWSLSRRYL